MILMNAPANDPTETYGDRYLVTYYRYSGPEGFDGLDSLELAKTFKKNGFAFGFRTTISKLSVWPRPKHSKEKNAE